MPDGLNTEHLTIMIFTIHQNVNIWQTYDIEAESIEAAIEMIKESPSLCNVEPISNIERMDETETILITELRDEDDNRLFVYQPEEVF